MGLTCKSTSNWACRDKPIRVLEGDLAAIINRELDSLWLPLDLIVVKAVRFSLAYFLRDRSSLLFLSKRQEENPSGTRVLVSHTIPPRLFCSRLASTPLPFTGSRGLSRGPIHFGAWWSDLALEISKACYKGILFIP